MRSSTTIFLTSLFAICGLLSLTCALRSWEVLSLSELTNASLSVESTISSNSFDKDMSKLSELWTGLEGALFSSSEASFQAGKASMISLRKETPIEEAVKRLCNSRQFFTTAVKRSPAEPRYRLALADVDVQLRSPELLCKNDKIEFIGDVRGAIALAPNSTYISYLGALVHLAANEKTQGLKLLRRNEELNPLFSKAQREFAFRLIGSSADLRNALPRRYPEVIHWVQHFREFRSDDYTQWKSIFSEALLDASNDLLSRYERRQLEFKMLSKYLKQIGRLPISETDSGLQKKLTPMLSDLYQREGNKTWSEFLRRRESLNRLPVLKTVVVDENSPKLSQLYGWTDDEDPRRVNFDHLGRAIGFFVPRDVRADTIVLQSAEGFTGLEPGSIKLLSSKDNLHFHEISNPSWIRKTHVDGRETFIINLKNSSSGRYFKLRYSGSERKPRFENSMYELVQVYGRKIS